MITTSSNTEVKYSRTKTTCNQNHIPEILSKSLTEAVIGRGATECTAVQSDGVTSAQILAIHTGCILMILGKYEVTTLARKHPVSFEWCHLLPLLCPF